MLAAINSMLKSLELALDLQFQKWLRSAANDSTVGGARNNEASMKLRDRVLKEAKVLPNDIIDVSRFMDAFVDVDLMDECGQELAERFVSAKPSKILTIATTGLVIAIRKLLLLRKNIAWKMCPSSVYTLLLIADEHFNHAMFSQQLQSTSKYLLSTLESKDR